MSAYQAPIDPTNVALKRIVSVVVDVGIAWVIYAILFAAFSKPNVEFFNSFNSSVNACGGASFCSSFGSRHVSGGTALLIWAVYWGYMVGVFVLQRGLTGKTLGTMAMGIVTVNEQGKPIGIGYALLRSVAGIVDYIPCCFPIVGTVTIFATKGHRRVGDMAGKSFVIDKAYAGQPVVVPGVTAPAAPGGPYAQPYGAAPYPGAPGPAPYPGQPPYPPQPQPGYGEQPQYPGQPQVQPGYGAAPQYPAQPQYGTPDPVAYQQPPPAAAPGTGWPAPAPATPSTEGSGWGAPGATDAPAAAPSPPAETAPVEPAPVETPPDNPAATPPPVAAAPVTPPETPPATAPETVEPTAPATPEPTVAPAPAAASPELAADPTQPQWDPARNAYIQWDPDGQRWLQYDDAAQQWRPIS